LTEQLELLYVRPIGECAGKLRINDVVSVDTSDPLVLGLSNDQNH
jgi:hypothetical protein